MAANKKSIRIGLSPETWQCIYVLLGGEIGRIQSLLVINSQAIAGNGCAETIRLARNAQDRIEDALREDSDAGTGATSETGGGDK